MNKLTSFALSGLIIVASFGCKKSEVTEIKSSDGKATLVLSSKEIFAEANQEIVLNGKGFPAGSISAGSITFGNASADHPVVTVSGDGVLPETRVKIASVLPLGDQEIKIAGLTFPAAVQVKPIQLEFMMWGLPSELETVKKFIDQFEGKFPNIRVKILHVPQMYDDKLKTMFAAKTPPDVMYMGLENFPSFVSRGVFLDLQPYVERDNKEFKKEDFYPNLMDIFKYKGDLYGIPKDFTTLALYYNKDLFDQAGVKYPDSTWTWKEFLDSAHKLTRDVKGTKTYGFITETWFGQYFPWIWQNGGEVMDAKEGKWLMGEPAYSEKSAKAIQFFADLIWKEGVAPKPAVQGDFGTKDMFMTGKVAMCTYGRWMCMDFKDIKNFKWDVAVLPKGERRATTLFTVCYAIAAQTRHPEASWQLMKFLTSPEGQVSVAESGLAIPSRKSVADTPHFLEAKVIPQKINARVFLDQVPFARPAPVHSRWVEVNERLGRELELVFLNKEMAVDAIKVIQPDIEKILSSKSDSEVAQK